MEDGYVNGLSDSPHDEQAAILERSRQSLQKPLSDAPEKAERRKPAPKLSEIDYLLTIWQSDCAELRQAGVKMTLEKDEINGTPAIILTLLEVNYCPQCQTFHDTKIIHTCIR